MLPFLQKKPVGGIATQVRKPDQPDQSDNEAPIKSCAQDLIDAVQSNDVQGVVSALRAVFEIMDSEPHVEGEHINEDQE